MSNVEVKKVKRMANGEQGMQDHEVSPLRSREVLMLVTKIEIS